MFHVACRRCPIFRSSINGSHPKPVRAAPLRNFALTTIRQETFNVQDEDDFQQKVIESKTPFVVGFTAKWCGPCQLLKPRLDAAIAGTEGRVHLAMVDIDELADLAMDHGVQAVPTVVGFKDGKPQDKFVGLIDDDKLDAFVQKLM